MSRQRAPIRPPVVLTIAGSDSGGGAGIQADLKTIEAGGAFGTSVITSVTAQHTRGVESTHLLPRDEIAAQYEAVTSDFDVKAVKTGMLATREIVELVTDRLADLSVPVVVDPVMVAASGDRLLDADAESAYQELAREATLLTPNADEAEMLTGVDIETTADARRAGEQLVAEGVNAVLLKGGHVPGDEVIDLLITEAGVERLSHPRVETDATHGSGCTLSAAIATRLGHDDDLPAAVRSGTDLLERAVRYSIDVGEGPGPVHHMVDIRNRARREPTAEAVRWVLRQFVDQDVSSLVPEVGMNIVGATPYAESPEECVAIEGRIGRTLDGIAPTGDVRFGASNHVARFLLSAREFEPEYRYALNCRFDDRVEEALESLNWAVGEFDRSEVPPVAVFDRGDHGKEPMTKLLAADEQILFERTMALLDELERTEE